MLKIRKLGCSGELRVFQYFTELTKKYNNNVYIMNNNNNKLSQLVDIN